MEINAILTKEYTRPEILSVLSYASGEIVPNSEIRLPAAIYEAGLLLVFNSKTEMKKQIKYIREMGGEVEVQP